jgi:hypothetical protein
MSPGHLSVLVLFVDAKGILKLGIYILKLGIQIIVPGFQILIVFKKRGSSDGQD